MGLDFSFIDKRHFKIKANIKNVLNLLASLQMKGKSFGTECTTLSIFLIFIFAKFHIKSLSFHEIDKVSSDFTTYIVLIFLWINMKFQV